MPTFSGSAPPAVGRSRGPAKASCVPPPGSGSGTSSASTRTVRSSTAARSGRSAAPRQRSPPPVGRADRPHHAARHPMDLSRSAPTAACAATRSMVHRPALAQRAGQARAPFPLWCAVRRRVLRAATAASLKELRLPPRRRLGLRTCSADLGLALPLISRSRSTRQSGPRRRPRDRAPRVLRRLWLRLTRHSRPGGCVVR